MCNGSNRRRTRRLCRCTALLTGRRGFNGVLGVGIVADPIVDFGERANCGEIFRRGAQYMFQLMARVVEAAELEQGSPEGDPGGQVCRVPLQASLTDGDRFVEIARPAM